MQIVSRKPADAPLARMGALAKLPVFLDVASKRAIVAGGTAPAAWKAELLAAAGAHVEIYAAQIGPGMAALLARGAAAGSLVHHPQPWRHDSLHGAAIALADAETEEEAQAFHDAARAAGVPVNVIDKPAYCQFQFGSIVNRSPVVVAISTDGAAPILGQAIRRRIEMLLPPSLAAWGRLARRMREAVGERLSPGGQRRAFWERLAERAFGPAPPVAEDECELHTLIDAIASGVAPRRGHVALVGAGPGDADLLTIKAVRALQSADVILYDDLVSNDVLELARREAKRMMVGKRGKRDSCRQEDINELMIKLAGQGKYVVRLKCGDPTLFGRAGEELETLAQAGIAVSIVPGITSALAMASRLGVSLTHRDHAQSVRFVTGHGRSGELPEHLDWRGLADPTTTLIVYMGGRTAKAFAARLMAEGLKGGTPVQAVASLTGDDERHMMSSLERIARCGLESWAQDHPVLIGIGDVFRYRFGLEVTETAMPIGASPTSSDSLQLTA
ncbi:MAG: siroheme synthase CysG [Hyphomicrobiaceae bacterium]